MGLFPFPKKRRASAQGFQPKPNPKSEVPQWEPMILEAMLTPSGLTDGTDSTPNPGWIDLNHSVIADLGLNSMESVIASHPAPEISAIADAPSGDVGIVHEVAGITPLPFVFEAPPAGAITDWHQLPFAVAPETGHVEPFSFVSGVFQVDAAGHGDIAIDYLHDGGSYRGELAIVSLDGMESLKPGSTEFIQEAARRAMSDSTLGHIVIHDATEGAKFNGKYAWEGNYNRGEYLGPKTVHMEAGSQFFVMLVPNGTVQQVLDNPQITGDKRPLFSLAAANPIAGLQFGQIGDVTGDGHTFAMEDQRVDKRTDRDYNDIVFHVKGATGSAPLLDSIINSQKDWRGTEVGHQLIDFVKTFDAAPAIAAVIEPISVIPPEIHEVPPSNVIEHPVPGPVVPDTSAIAAVIEPIPVVPPEIHEVPLPIVIELPAATPVIPDTPAIAPVVESGSVIVPEIQAVPPLVIELPAAPPVVPVVETGSVPVPISDPVQPVPQVESQPNPPQLPTSIEAVVEQPASPIPPLAEIPSYSESVGTVDAASNDFVQVLDFNAPAFSARFDNSTQTHTTLLWRNYTTGTIENWWLNPTESSDLMGRSFQERVDRAAVLPVVSDANWQIRAVGDANQDGQSDILWRNLQTGQNVLWTMQGTTLVSATLLQPVADPAWQIEAAADFNQDGNIDIVWRNTQTGQNVLWYMDETGQKIQTYLNQTGQAVQHFSLNLPTVQDQGWQIYGSGDFNGDSHPDLVWRNSRTGENALWLLGGAQGDQYQQGLYLPTVTNLNWKMQGVGDFNQDGNADILWRNMVTGEMVEWRMNGTAFEKAVWLPNVPTNQNRQAIPFTVIEKRPTVELSLKQNSGTPTFGITRNATIDGKVSADRKITEVQAKLISDSSTVPTALNITANLRSDGSFTLTPQQLAQLNQNKPLSDGRYTLEIVAYDLHRNQSQPTQLTFTLDTKPSQPGCVAKMIRW